VEYFVDRYARKAGKNIKHINKKTLQLLQSYFWPGNIRELQTRYRTFRDPLRIRHFLDRRKLVATIAAGTRIETPYCAPQSGAATRGQFPTVG